MNEKTVERKLVYEGRIINLRVDKVLLPNGREALREIVEHPGAVAVIPVLPDGRIVLVRQFRKPVEEALLEIPAGKLEKEENPETCAMRELEEETGFRAGKLEKIFKFFPSPGFSDECIHLFKAAELQKGKMNPEHDELIETVILTPSEIVKLIEEGKIKDGKTIIAAFYLLSSPSS
jgi:ADP-ribose pyrophosphatase